jgi:hypothetical protein
MLLVNNPVSRFGQNDIRYKWILLHDIHLLRTCKTFELSPNIQGCFSTTSLSRTLSMSVVRLVEPNSRFESKSFIKLMHLPTYINHISWELIVGLFLEIQVEIFEWSPIHYTVYTIVCQLISNHHTTVTKRIQRFCSWIFGPIFSVQMFFFLYKSTLALPCSKKSNHILRL